MREPRRGKRESRSGEKEKPLVTLDLNLTFMQTPGYPDPGVPEVFLSRRFATRVCPFAALSCGEKSRKTSGTRVHWQLKESKIQLVMLLPNRRATRQIQQSCSELFEAVVQLQERVRKWQAFGRRARSEIWSSNYSSVPNSSI